MIWSRKCGTKSNKLAMFLDQTMQQRNVIIRYGAVRNLSPPLRSENREWAKGARLTNSTKLNYNSDRSESVVAERRRSERTLNKIRLQTTWAPCQFVWIVQKKKKEHTFNQIKKTVSYATGLGSRFLVEKGKMNKVTGNRSEDKGAVTMLYVRRFPYDFHTTHSRACITHASMHQRLSSRRDIKESD
jgi:hypothetical protein